MSLRIHLMGPPRLVRDGAVARLDGRKTWALLAYLLLEPRGATRRELVGRLWSEADDPLGAARWTLSQVRRALAPEAAILERDARLVFDAAGDATVDVREVLEGRWDAATIEDLVPGDLLEACDLEDAPEYSRWLAVQRARLAGAARDALRWSASLSARVQPERALALAERALLADPYDEATHELIVEIHVARGDRARAAEHALRTEARYRGDLGIELPRTILRPLERPSPAAGVPLLRIDVQARALLETAYARGYGGDYGSSREIAVRAAREAAASGDGALEVRAIVEGARSFTVGGAGTGREWAGQLQRALRLASELGDPRLTAAVEVERGRIAAIEGRYGPAEASLHRAMALSREAGDTADASWARTMIGMCRLERGEVEAAEADLRAAAAAIPVPFVVASHARALLALGRIDEALARANEAIGLAEARVRMGPLQWALAVAGEARVRHGDLDGAEEVAGRLHTIAIETHIPSMQALALRILALVAVERADRATARELLGEAVRHARSEGHQWIVARVLADLVEVERGADAEHVEEGMRIALAGPIPYLIEHFGRFRAHTPAHTLPA